jgi:hypothetical protein
MNLLTKSFRSTELEFMVNGPFWAFGQRLGRHLGLDGYPTYQRTGVHSCNTIIATLYLRLAVQAYFANLLCMITKLT